MDSDIEITEEACEAPSANVPKNIWQFTYNKEKSEVIIAYVLKGHDINAIRKGVNPSPLSYGLNSRVYWGLYTLMAISLRKL